MARLTPEYLERAFHHFSELCREQSPLYTELSTRVAENDEVRSLAGDAARGQPAVNLLFAAVQYLLLRGTQHELRGFYRSLVENPRDADDCWPVFQEFCREHRRTIKQLVSTRRVQTNELGRCGMLLPAFARVEQAFDQPLSLIEVGASMGLNLLFDQYCYLYSSGAVAKEGAPRPGVELRIEERGRHAVPLPRTMPRVGHRVGIDINPIDVRNKDAAAWVQALIWPDEVDRHDRLRRAVEIACQDSPTIVEGEALEQIAALIESVPSGDRPCVFHSHAIYQMTDDWQAAFDAELDAAGRERDLARISLEWLKDDPQPELRLTVWRGSEPLHAHLASCHHHGRWIEWKGA